MSLSFLALILLAVLGLVVVGGVAALCNKRTRWLGYLLLLLPVGLAALLAFRTFGFAALGGIATPAKSIIAMPIVAILVVGAIAALVALLSNKRTRPIGFVLLAIPVVLGCLAVVGLLVSFPVQHRRITNINTVPQTQVQELPLPSPAKTTKSLQPKQSAKITSKPKAEASRKKSGRVVEAIGMALGKSLSDLNRPRSKQAEKKPATQTPPVKKLGDKVDEKTAVQISKMVEVLSKAVQEELPDNVEIDQFTALRALGKLLGRMIASQRQEELDTEKTSVVAKPASGLDMEKTTAVAKPASGLDIAKLASGLDNERLPDWVEAPPQRVGEGYQMVFVVGPYTTRLECDQALGQPLARAVAEYADLYMGRDAAGKATLPLDFLRKHVIKDECEETFRSMVGPMVRVHVRLLFDVRTNTELKASYRGATIEERIWYAGGGLGALLIVLAGCFAVLKFDQATGGDYRGRMVFALFFVVVMATSVAGTGLLVSLRPVSVPVATDVMLDANTPVSRVPERASEIRETAVAQARDANPLEFKKDIGFFTLIALPLLCLACLGVTMLFFRKTRKIALILLSLGVVLVVGTLVLVI